MPLCSNQTQIAHLALLDPLVPRVFYLQPLAHREDSLHHHAAAIALHVLVVPSRQQAMQRNAHDVRGALIVSKDHQHLCFVLRALTRTPRTSPFKEIAILALPALLALLEATLPQNARQAFFKRELEAVHASRVQRVDFKAPQAARNANSARRAPTLQLVAPSRAATACPILAVFQARRRDVCDVGFYRRDAQTVPLTETCASCDLLEGGECALNTTVDTISVLPGYWRHSGRATLIYKCEGPDALDRCLGGSDAGVDGQRYCSTNRTGPECQICNDGFYSDRSGACSECPELGAFLAAMYLLLIAAILLVACCFLTALLHPAVQQIAVMRGIYLLMARLQFYCKTMNLVSKMKILFSFYGVVTVIDETYDAKLPSVYTSWLHDAFSWATMDWPSLFFSLECSPLPALSMSSFRLWLLVRALTPLIFVLLAIFVGSVFKFFLSGKTLSGVKQGILSSTPLLLVVIFAFVPSVSMHIFRSWLCVEYQIDAADASHISYLVHDLHVQCDGNEEHNEYDHITRTAFALIWIWPVGSVLMYFAVLLPCRFSLRSHVPRPLLWATKFLHKDYRIEFYYWEVIELVRRTVIVGWVLLIPTSESFLRLVVALLLSIASLTLLLTFQPYKMPADNVLAGLCQLTIVIVFIGATYTRLYEQISILNGGAEAQRVMIFSSTDIIALPLVIMTAGMTLAMVLIMATHLYNEGMLYTIQLKETKKLPELTYEPRKKWHLFLSHVWGTGQDANATIKRQMQRLLTGISVFLDVDDLHELDLLETYIDQSMAVSFFLSRGYFKSLNCMREVRATICGQKPLKLIQETDTSKGGGEVDAVKLELDDAELMMAIFCANRIITPWYRVMEFQLVSLKKILEFTLLQTPCYKNRTELSLCIPGEASLEKIILKRPVHIYASVYNAGAKNFAMELQEAFPSLRCSDDKECVYAQRNNGPSDAYFMVYLNSETFSGEDGRKFADEIWQLCFGCKPQQYNKLGSTHPRTCTLSAPLPIILVHENDRSRNGCEFSRFFTSTPAELIENGLYAKLAIPAYPENSYRAVSLCMVGQTVAQNHDSTDCFSRPSNLLQWRIQLRKSQRVAQAVGKRVVQAVALPDLSEASAQKGTSDPQIAPKSV